MAKIKLLNCLLHSFLVWKLLLFFSLLPLLFRRTFGFLDREYAIHVQNCKSISEPATSNDNYGREKSIPLPTSLLDVTVVNKTKTVLKAWGEVELECQGKTKSIFLNLQESEPVVAPENSSSVASRGIWDPRPPLTFTTGGLLQIGENVLYSEQFCLKRFTDSQLEIMYCDEKCEETAKVCLPKCCGPYQRITHDDMHCSSMSYASDHPFWFSLYRSPHREVYFRNQEKLKDNHMKFTRPDITKHCKAEQIRSVSFSNIPINGSKYGTGYFQWVLNDGSIVFQQSPVHWRRLRLPDKSKFCVDTSFKRGGLDERYDEYKTEELHAIFWCPENKEEDLRPSVSWEVAPPKPPRKTKSI